VTAKSVRALFPVVPGVGGARGEMGDAKLARRSGRSSFGMNEWDGTKSMKGPDRKGISNPHSIIDCPGMNRLATRAENERYHMANHVRQGME
jgi:hypothetical protein